MIYNLYQIKNNSSLKTKLSKLYWSIRLLWKREPTFLHSLTEGLKREENLSRCHFHNLIDQLQVNRALAYNMQLHGFLHPRGISKATLETCYSLESPILCPKKRQVCLIHYYMYLCIVTHSLKRFLPSNAGWRRGLLVIAVAFYRRMCRLLNLPPDSCRILGPFQAPCNQESWKRPLLDCRSQCQAANKTG